MTAAVSPSCPPMWPPPCPWPGNLLTPTRRRSSGLGAWRRCTRRPGALHWWRRRRCPQVATQSLYCALRSMILGETSSPRSNQTPQAFRAIVDLDPLALGHQQVHAGSAGQGMPTRGIPPGAGRQDLERCRSCACSRSGRCRRFRGDVLDEGIAASVSRPIHSHPAMCQDRGRRPSVTARVVRCIGALSPIDPGLHRLRLAPVIGPVRPSRSYGRRFLPLGPKAPYRWRGGGIAARPTPPSSAASS